jgi:hypothetical protein
MTLNIDSDDDEEFFKNKPKTKCKICNKEILLISLNFHNNILLKFYLGYF